jgi:endonuclease III
MIFKERDHFIETEPDQLSDLVSLANSTPLKELGHRAWSVFVLHSRVYIHAGKLKCEACHQKAPCETIRILVGDSDSGI